MQAFTGSISLDRQPQQQLKVAAACSPLQPLPQRATTRCQARQRNNGASNWDSPGLDPHLNFIFLPGHINFRTYEMDLTTNLTKSLRLSTFIMGGLEFLHYT
ncbi:hypothetical protein WJX75_004270 [Coccomyxa subellipsoidea]|uniref:Uncharacterized protein n=1 Tax=Coccomyxa subellipsoidea TaxID=248742 RepID=A0ABR2YVG6_9CHLO